MNRNRHSPSHRRLPPRRRSAPWLVSAAAGLVLAGPSATRLEAQGLGEGDQWGAWVGASFQSRGPLGVIAGRELFLVGIRWTRPLSQRRWRFAYQASVIPAAVMTNNASAELRRISRSLGWWSAVSPTSSVTGFGANPLGVTIETPALGPLTVAGLASGGLLWFERPVPYRNATRLNFVGEAGLEGRIRLGGRWTLALGYRIHHLSNAGTGDVNPGVDGRLFHVGVDWKW